MDDRCSECDVCAGIAQKWPPPPLPHPPPALPSASPPLLLNDIARSSQILDSPPSPMDSPPPPPRTLSAPTALAGSQINCSAITLNWKPPAGGMGAFEYELVVHQVASSQASMSTAVAPFALAGIKSPSYMLENLESSSDYVIQVRGRGITGWGPFSAEFIARTNPPLRTLSSPEAPIAVQTSETLSDISCETVQLRLPPLRRGCAREDMLSLEYKVAGDADWHEYNALTTPPGQVMSITIPKARVAGSASFRLRAHRGPIISEPSAALGPLTLCAMDGPMRSPLSVQIAVGIAAILLLGCVLCICRTSSHGGTASLQLSSAPKDREGMTRLKTTDEDERLEPGENGEEISVRYDLGNGEPIEGFLPLAGINGASELLEELAEFGCELQDDIVLSVYTIEATFTDQRGKERVIGPRTPFHEAIEADQIIVSSKATVPRKTPRVINGTSKSVEVRKPPTSQRTTDGTGRRAHH